MTALNDCTKWGLKASWRKAKRNITAVRPKREEEKKLDTETPVSKIKLCVCVCACMRVRMCLRTCMRANTVAVYTPGKSHCYSHSVVRTFSLSAQLFPFHHPGQFCVLWFTLSLCQCAGKFQPKHLATFKGNKQKISAWFSNSNLQSMVQTKLNCKQTTEQIDKNDKEAKSHTDE